MAGLDFLDTKHAIYESHEAAWKREERRLAGGDAVLSELIQFSHEETTSYTDRQKWARWVNFARIHTTILSGHLRRQMPLPDMGELGEIRTRAEQQGDPTDAELFFYNCDGVGSDGSQLPAYMDGVEQRSLATGFRWLLVEMPSKETLETIRAAQGRGTAEGKEPAPLSDADVASGVRPFLVEYSPLSVTNWRYRDGVLVWAVVRIELEPETDFDQAQAGDGYYLLVRKGYEGLGAEFSSGGWWKYDPSKKEVSRGTWDDTDGQIPMWQHIGEPGNGTFERPSIGQSSTMELGQISADMMNAVSEQRHNARQAAKSINYILGISPDAHASVITQQTAGSITVGVPPVMYQDGSVGIPTIWNSAEAAMATQVYDQIIANAFGEAKEIMVRQVTAGPDASGARVDADHAQNTAPMLSRIAATAETSWNTMIYFVEKRFGIADPTGTIEIPRDFQLRDVMGDIDSMLQTLQGSGLRSPTLERSLALRKADELGLMPDDDAERTNVEDELTAAAMTAKAAVFKAQLEAVASAAAAGANELQAAIELGMDPAVAGRLFGDQSGAPADEEEEPTTPRAVA
jgi:hypothetical protein